MVGIGPPFMIYIDDIYHSTEDESPSISAVSDSDAFKRPPVHFHHRGISTDMLIRVLAATGHRVEVRVKKAAGGSKEVGTAPMLVLCSRNARPEKGLVRRPQ